MAYQQLAYPLPGFSLRETLFCGQTFSWEEISPDHFLGIAEQRAVIAFYKEETLFLQNISFPSFSKEDNLFWQYYFALDLNYDDIKLQLGAFSPLDIHIAFSPGIRVLRQPFFDTLLAFIISQNNHIPRITSIAKNLRKTFGKEIANNIYSYPTAKDLSSLSLEDLSPLKAGFRSKYLLDAAKKVADFIVEEQVLQTLPDQQAREYLKQIYGVGNKVADCILLFSQGRNNIVPMDVWMKKAMELYFPKGYPEEILPYGGIAQQFTFNWAKAHIPKGK